MKTTMSVAVCLFVLSLFISPVLAAPLDLSTFSDPGFTGYVGIGTDSINFTESLDYGAIYAADDYWVVPDGAESLSFDYSLTLGDYDYDDYLTFEIDFATVSDFTDATGYFSFDLTSYVGQKISVAWGLIWNGDWDADTTASIFNIELNTSTDEGDVAPVPEPGTFLLLGSGLAGLAWLRRKKK
jgi:PEP-CTERM motif